MKRERQLVGNTDDPEQVQEAARKERAIQDDELDCWRWVLESPAGRRVLWDVMEAAGVWKSSWDPGNKIHFFEGARYIGLHILSKIKQVGNQTLTLCMDEAKMREEKR